MIMGGKDHAIIGGYSRPARPITAVKVKGIADEGQPIIQSIEGQRQQGCSHKAERPFENRGRMYGSVATYKNKVAPHLGPHREKILRIGRSTRLSAKNDGQLFGSLNELHRYHLMGQIEG